VTEDGRGATGPEQQPHDDTHGASDRDVLDPYDAHGPARGLEEVEQDQDRHGESGLPGREGDRRRGEAREQDGDGEQDPQQRGVRTDQVDQPAADDDADGGTGDRPQGVLPGQHGAGAQDGQCAEGDPEAVLHARQLRDQDGERE
jgi:hypothetical protein